MKVSSHSDNWFCTDVHEETVWPEHDVWLSISSRYVVSQNGYATYIYINILIIRSALMLFESKIVEKNVKYYLEHSNNFRSDFHLILQGI